MTLPTDGRLARFDTREQWLAARGIGGTDVAKILDESDYGGPWDVWAERQPGVERIDRSSSVMERGKELEPMVAADYVRTTGHRLGWVGQLIVVRHAEFPWATCSPDGLVYGPDGQVEGGVEIKTAGDRDDDWSKGVPDRNIHQVLWSLEVTGLPWFDVAAWVSRPFQMPELIVHRVEADRARQRLLLRDVVRWRKKHLVEGVPPELDASKAARRYLNRNAPRGGDVRDATPEEAELVVALAHYREQKNALVSEIERVETELSLAFSDHTYGVRTPTTVCKRVRGRAGDVVLDMATVRATLPHLVRQGAEYHRFNLTPVKPKGGRR